MKNKKTLLVSFAVASSLAIGASIFAINSHKSNISLLNADEVHPGMIVIDTNNPDLTLDYGYIEVNSKDGNPFRFDCYGITIEDGYFVMSSDGSFFTNHDILNGLTELRFLTPDYSQNINLGRALNHDVSMDFAENEMDANQAVISFTDYHPGYFYIETFKSEEFKFSRLTIYYECVADTPSFSIKQLENHGTVGGHRISTPDCLFIHQGDNLSTISLNDCYIDTDSGKGFSINDSLVSNVSITYKSSESVTALEGSNLASLSFSYGGATYSSDEITIVGYDHVNYNIQDIYLDRSEFLRQENDSTIPTDFTLSSGGDLECFNSSDEKFDTFNSYNNDIPVTEEMIVESDSNRFTGLGNHKVKISYNEIVKEFNYQIYDPTINNIRYISFQGKLQLDVGSSIQDFVTLVTSSEFFIDYYDRELAKDLPYFVVLSQDNFDLTEGMFDTAGYVEVPVHYSTYSGTVSVYVQLAKGNLVKTYTNEDGVSVFGDPIYEIAIYDNNTCELNPGPDSEVFTYRIEDDKLIVNFFESVEITFLIDDVNDTFDKYSSSGNLMYTFKTNFHNAFPGAPNDYLYNANVYDDYSIIFEMGPGTEVSATFTIDQNDSEKIYFTFMGEQCYGMVDFDLLQLTVYLVE